MAGYAFQSLQVRQVLQTRWEQGQTAKALAEALSVSLSTIYTELHRGRLGDRLLDQRLKYEADLAQLRMQQELDSRMHEDYGNNGAVLAIENIKRAYMEWQKNQEAHEL